VDRNLRITAINNRLNALLQLGLVRSEGVGKNRNPFCWFPVEPDPIAEEVLAMTPEEVRQSLRDSGISDERMDKAKGEMHERFRQIREREGRL
jgi:hypothetical protein